MVVMIAPALKFLVVLIFGRPFVIKRFALCYRTVVLSVTLVHCGQTVERIKVKLGVRVCLSPDHIVLDGDPSPPPQRGTALLPIFGPYLLRPNGCMDFQRVIFPYCLRLASHGSGTLVVLYVLRMLV